MALSFLFNDDIKSNSTVSKFTIDPFGKIGRATILNTNSKELLLRFKDAVQLNYNTLIVPSQIGHKLNIVKIKFED